MFGSDVTLYITLEEPALMLRISFFVTFILFSILYLNFPQKICIKES